MNVITLPTRRREPVLSDAMKGEISRHEMQSRGITMPTPTPEVRAEARAALAAYGPMMAPVTWDDMKAWLLPLVAVVRNPPSGDEDDFNGLVTSFATVCRDIPRAALNDETRLAALRTFAFWPAAADVYDLLSKASAGLVKRIGALQDIAHEPVSVAVQTVVTPMTAEERAASVAEVAQKLGALRSELAEPTQAPRSLAQSAKPMHLSPAQLSEIYKKEGLKDPRAGQ